MKLVRGVERSLYYCTFYEKSLESENFEKLSSHFDYFVRFMALVIQNDFEFREFAQHGERTKKKSV